MFPCNFGHAELAAAVNNMQQTIANQPQEGLVHIHVAHMPACTKRTGIGRDLAEKLWICREQFKLFKHHNIWLWSGATRYQKWCLVSNRTSGFVSLLRFTRARASAPGSAISRANHLRVFSISWPVVTLVLVNDDIVCLYLSEAGVLPQRMIVLVFQRHLQPEQSLPDITKQPQMEKSILDRIVFF